MANYMILWALKHGNSKQTFTSTISCSPYDLKEKLDEIKEERELLVEKLHKENSGSFPVTVTIEQILPLEG